MGRIPCIEYIECVIHRFEKVCGVGVFVGRVPNTVLEPMFSLTEEVSMSLGGH